MLWYLSNNSQGAKFKKYVGHSAHVTNIRFSLDGQSVLSVGGADHAIFQWRFNPQEEEDGSGGDEFEERDDTSLLPVDSDVEKDNERSYERLYDKAQVMRLQKRNRKKERPSTSLAAKRSNQVFSQRFRPATAQGYSKRSHVVANESQDGPDDSLQLEHVFGWVVVVVACCGCVLLMLRVECCWHLLLLLLTCSQLVADTEASTGGTTYNT